MPDSIALARLFEPAVVAGESVWLASDANARELPAPAGRGGNCRVSASKFPEPSVVNAPAARASLSATVTAFSP